MTTDPRRILSQEQVDELVKRWMTDDPDSYRFVANDAVDARLAEWLTSMVRFRARKEAG